MNREELELLALEKVDPEFYYQLHDTIQEATNGDLLLIINKNFVPLP